MNVKYFINNPKFILIRLIEIFNVIFPDKLYLRILFRLKMGKALNLKNPQTFNEKLQWLKLYNRDTKYTKLVDKYAVKKIVENIIGKQYIIPTLGVWDNPEDIEWDKLPNQFVLKTTHGGGNTGVVICKNKNDIDKVNVIRLLKKALKQDISKNLREWPYAKVPKKIIAEKYMEDEFGELRDYKFFVFDGMVHYMFIATDRGKGDVKFDFFDRDFKHLDLVQVHPMSNSVIEKPLLYDEMIEISEKLAKGIPHVRVDLYEINGNIYFGEYTFFHHGGITPFHPIEWDYKFGDLIKLPVKK